MNCFDRTFTDAVGHNTKLSYLKPPASVSRTSSVHNSQPQEMDISDGCSDGTNEGGIEKSDGEDESGAVG